jgi:hypothetical protein
MSKFNLLLAGLILSGNLTTELLTGQPANAQRIDPFFPFNAIRTILELGSKEWPSPKPAEIPPQHKPTELSWQEKQHITDVVNDFMARRVHHHQVQQEAQPKDK